MSKTRTLQQLTPEQNKAVQKFLSLFPDWKEQQIDMPKTVLPSNFFSFSLNPFPKLIHDISWIWNQTNSRILIKLDDDDNCGDLVLQKLNARKRRGYPKAPSYKVWQFSYSQEKEPSSIFGIWCEKGFDGKESSVTAEKRVVQGNGVRFSMDPILEIPSLQQVRDFNKNEAQWKKRKLSLDSNLSPPQKYRKLNPIQQNMIKHNDEQQNYPICDKYQIPIKYETSPQIPCYSYISDFNKPVPQQNELKIEHKPMNFPQERNAYASYFQHSTPVLPYLEQKLCVSDRF